MMPEIAPTLAPTLAPDAAAPPLLGAADTSRGLALFRAKAQRGQGRRGWRLDTFLRSDPRRAVVQAASFAAGQRRLDVGTGLGDTVRAAGPVRRES